MNARLAKEIHPLLLPGCVGAAAALAQLFKLSGIYEFLATFTFSTCVCLIAAIPFGTEFQQRTFPLLLSQPLERFRMWQEKLGAIGVVAGPLILLRVIEGRPSFSDTVGIAGFLFVILCSAAFWTLIARSTIGGMVFSVTIQFGVIAIVAGIEGLAELLFKFDLDELLKKIPIAARIPIFIVAGPLAISYCALFVWLGWRKFAALEVKEISFGESPVASESASSSHWWSRLFRCRPAGKYGNLIRKELRLLKPVFGGAAILCLCWLVVTAVFWLTPLNKEVFHGILTFLAVVLIVVLPMVTALIAQTEEKGLGLRQWHLTLPISAGAQWLTKLLTAAGVAFLVGVILPLLLAWLSVPEAFSKRDGGLITVGAVVAIVFVLGFWAGTLMENAVQALLAAIVALAVIAGSIAVGSYAELGLQAGLLQIVLSRFQLPPDFFSRAGLDEYALLLMGAVVIDVALAQSLIRFRRAQAGGKGLVRIFLPLAIAAFLSSAWRADLFTSSDRLASFSWLRWELANALRSLHLNSSNLWSDRAWHVTSQELEGTGNLSPQARRWLKNSSVTVTAGKSRPPAPTTYQVGIRFLNGRTYEFVFNGPPPEQKASPSNNNQTTPKPNQ
jgi:hypothetical protein